MDSSNDAKGDAHAASRADAEQNPSGNLPNGGDDAANGRRRTPFTDLSQIDADLALARTLQEQVSFLGLVLVSITILIRCNRISIVLCLVCYVMLCLLTLLILEVNVSQMVFLVQLSFRF